MYFSTIPYTIGYASRCQDNFAVLCVGLERITTQIIFWLSNIAMIYILFCPFFLFCLFCINNVGSFYKRNYYSGLFKH